MRLRAELKLTTNLAAESQQGPPHQQARNFNAEAAAKLRRINAWFAGELA